MNKLAVSATLLAAVFTVAIYGAGCGSDGAPASTDLDGGDTDATDPFATGDGSVGQGTLDVQPKNPTIDYPSATKQAFQAFVSGSKTPIPATWGIDKGALGTFDSNGTFTASGNLGGTGTVTATSGKATGSTLLTVILHLQENPGNVGAADQTKLKAGGSADPGFRFLYPYDQTVFPRGLAAPVVQLGGTAANAFYIHIKAKLIDYEGFYAGSDPARVTMSAATWKTISNSVQVNDPMSVEVTKLFNGAVTGPTKETWTIAPGSMRGTVYYWSNNLGRILRLKPGATAPDDFLAAAGVTGCSTCHVVSADGSTLVVGGDVATSTFDLKTNTTTLSNMGRAWAMPALSPDGKYLVQNASPLPSPPGGSDGLWLTANAQRVAASGLDGLFFGMPAFSPDGSILAYRGEGSGLTPGSLRAFDFDPKTAKATNDRELVPPGSTASLATISFPTATPDGKWIVYGRGDTLDTRFGVGDLYIASSTTAGVEARLAKVNGDGYPFAAGARDLSWNFEPTFAPVAAGGYYWVVFTSRRTYGNTLIDTKDATKQLWVVAIDQNPKPGVDASHPAFWLPGQDVTSLNMRGFWALDPCKPNGDSCETGDECCGGYCRSTEDGGLSCVPPPSGCAQEFEKCSTAGDCCGTGALCINGHCAKPAPN
ncbi:hypothetical protein BH09MYX1_BH09MYX1_58770 [soil metagenome]